jgi:hypothetical protein
VRDDDEWLAQTTTSTKNKKVIIITQRKIDKNPTKTGQGTGMKERRKNKKTQSCSGTRRRL